MTPSPSIDIPTVGAAEGCDLLIFYLTARSKDRSLRQLLQGQGERAVQAKLSACRI
jgi:hypothetical protein